VLAGLRAWLLLLPLAAGLGIALSPVAAAQDPLVYWPLVTDGAEYRRVPYPAEAGALVVLADTEVIVEARYAPVSYWPITREYLADLSQEPRRVDGTVEVVDSSGAVTVVAPDGYVLWHPAGVGGGPARLVRGAAATQLYQDYVAAARASAEEERAYQRIVAEHQAAVEAWLKLAAERPVDLPPPPPELDIAPPAPFRGYATEPREAAIVSLPAGSYTVRLRGADGTIVPGSERELVSFGPLDHAIGYVLRPEDRWTRPVVSFAPDEAIYTTGRTDLFFQPVPVVAYQALSWNRLFQPQSVQATDPSLTLWVPRQGDSGAIEGATLALFDADTLIETLSRTPYRVAQIPNVARGYVIEPFAPREGASLAPDFHAMRVGRDLPVTRVSLLGGAAALPASERQVRRLVVPAEPLLFLPCLLPLAVFLLLRARVRVRRRAAPATGAGENPSRAAAVAHPPAPGSRPLHRPRGQTVQVQRETAG
jgi:hypothetical protein